MFYSHDILTSRKYGVATVWLVATLGSKSTLKKVGRKDILNVDVPKACETVTDPEVPLALRLQGNLLFGLTRVYEQKCVYLLSDIESARTLLRDLNKRLDAGNTLTTTHVARREQITLQDDPNLILEDLYSAQAFDPVFDLNPFSSSPGPRSRSSSLLPSLENSQNTLLSFEDENLAFNLPPSDSSQSNHPFHEYGGSERSRRSEPEPRLLDDPFMDIDDLGNIIDRDLAKESPTHREESVSRRDTTPPIRHLQGVEDAVMREEDDLPPLQHDVEDVYAMPFERDVEEPNQASEVIASSTEASSAHAPQKRTRKPKTITSDEVMEIPSDVIRDWEVNYVQNMAEAKEAKERHRAPHLARVNAEFLIYNNVLGMGQLFGKDAAPGPLQQFLGQAFFDAVAGRQPQTTPPKRTHDEASSETEGADRRVRSRSSNDEAGRGGGDLEPMFDDQGFTDLDNTLEQGRAGATPLADRVSASASMMPWNMSASQRASSNRRAPLRLGSVGVTSSAGPGTSYGALYSRRPSTAPSPTVARGRLTGRGISVEAPPNDETGFDFPPDDYDLGAPTSQSEQGQGIEFGDTQEREYQRFGLAAGVDTQTANEPGWLAQTLDNEAMNFLTFVHTSIADRKEQRMIAEQLGQPVDLQNENFLDFEDLLSPVANSRIVAAQGFLHVLTLGTKGLLSVEQAMEFGQVVLGVL
ncbi:hypothetical protein MBLNU457_3319t1 [Dothideomycetes sp. NU457]